MASAVGGTSSSNLSSLYNSANMISGLASGLDTEGMIESLVQSYSKKITSLQQKNTKTEWKQEAYRSIISKMSTFSNKYTSYTSSTNLLSNSFFTNSTSVVSKGTHKDKVTASGKTTSNILLNEVNQLATSARWTTKGNNILGDSGKIVGSKDFDLAGKVELGTLDGSLTLNYGSSTISLVFDDATDNNIKAEYNANGDVIKTAGQKLAEVIESKLSEETITLSGKAYKASDVINVSYDDATGELSLKDIHNNKFYISGASGTLKDKLGLSGDLNETAKITSFKPNAEDDNSFIKKTSAAEYLSGSTMSIKYNGTTKKITLPTVTASEADENGAVTYTINGDTNNTITVRKDNEEDKAALHKKYIDALNVSLKDAFGTKATTDENSSNNKVTAILNNDGKLVFYGDSGDDEIVINADKGNALGIGTVATSYLNTGKTLSDLGIQFTDDMRAKDDKGNLLKDKSGNDLYEFKIGDTVVGNYSKDTTLSQIMSDINSSDAGVKVTYSKLSNNFVFTAKETGEDQQIKIEDGLAAAIFGKTSETGTYKPGDDAKFTITINGEEKTLTRSSNSVELDGLTLNFKEKFDGVKDTNGKFVENDAVSFEVSVDTEPIVEAIKTMVAEYNVMMGEIKSAYTTLPTTKSNGDSYEPLTDDDMADMTESAIEKYEEKAKRGLLFGDSTLSALYEKMRFLFSPGGEDGALLQKMGISTSYSSADGALTVTVDEKKLTAMLESDIDAVADVFTRTASTSGGTDGIMQKMKKVLDTYSATTGATKGLLVQKAGTPLSSLSLLNNTWQKEIDRVNEDIERWQDKLATQVDYYTNQFTRLETLINQMNSQSGALAGLMGG